MEQLSSSLFVSIYMRSRTSLFAFMGLALMALAVVTPLQAQRNKTLEERVAALEYDVAKIKQDIARLSGTGYGQPPRRTYAGIGQTWMIKYVAQNRSVIGLADGSRWAIEARSQTFVYKWKLNDTVTIEAGNNKDYPYILLNNERKERIEAQYQGTQ